MKKYILPIWVLITFLMGVPFNNVKVDAKNYDNLTTLNYDDVLNGIQVNSIQKLCTYDYCDYLRGQTLDESMKIFHDNYINRLTDVEKKNSLNVKGVKISKIIFYTD